MRFVVCIDTDGNDIPEAYHQLHAFLTGVGPGLAWETSDEAFYSDPVHATDMQIPVDVLNRGITEALEQIPAEYRRYRGGPNIVDLAENLSKLTALLDTAHTTLKLVALGIHRDPSRNACWLRGEAIAVHEVERTLGAIVAHKEGVE